MTKTMRLFKISFSHHGLKGAKVTINDLHYNKRRMIPYDHETGNTLDTALNWFKRKTHIDIVGSAILPNHYILITQNLGEKI